MKTICFDIVRIRNLTDKEFKTYRNAYKRTAFAKKLTLKPKSIKLRYLEQLIGMYTPKKDEANYNDYMYVEKYIRRFNIRKPVTGKWTVYKKEIISSDCRETLYGFIGRKIEHEILQHYEIKELEEDVFYPLTENMKDMFEKDFAVCAHDVEDSIVCLRVNEIE